MSLLLLVAGHACADTPLPPPAREKVCSAAGMFCAVSDPVADATVVSIKGSSAPLWTIPGWHRWLFVADDGESVVVGYPGMNLVPPDVALTQPVLSFYHCGEPVRAVTLAELYRDKSQLAPTVSHHAWTKGIGFNHAGQLVVELIDGRRLAFAAKTGQAETLVADVPASAGDTGRPARP